MAEPCTAFSMLNLLNLKRRVSTRSRTFIPVNDGFFKTVSGLQYT
jgi:hypothetical protein